MTASTSKFPRPFNTTSFTNITHRRTSLHRTMMADLLHLLPLVMGSTSKFPRPFKTTSFTNITHRTLHQTMMADLPHTWPLAMVVVVMAQQPVNQGTPATHQASKKVLLSALDWTYQPPHTHDTTPAKLVQCTETPHYHTKYWMSASLSQKYNINII